jgi:hypothetical protein
MVEDGERELRAIEEVLRARERARVEERAETAFGVVVEEGAPAALSAQVVAQKAVEAGSEEVPVGAETVLGASEAMRIEGAKSQANAPTLSTGDDGAPDTPVDGIVDGADCAPTSEVSETITPPHRPNPELPSSAAPLGPSNPLRAQIPAGVTRRDIQTPTPGGGVELTA